MEEFFKFLSYGSLFYFTSSEELPVVFEILFLLSALACIVLPYLLGSVNFAIVISKKLYNDDIRKYGSGNAGMTNMMRTYGKKAGLLTLGGDIGKGVVSCILGYLLLGINGAYLAGFFCVFGHDFPIFYKFKGGKGVATAAAVVLMGNPFVFLIMLVIFAAILLMSKFVSLASIMSLLVYPMVLYGADMVLGGGGGAYIALAFFMSATVIFMHRENIKRLIEQKEPRFDFSILKSKKNK